MRFESHALFDWLLEAAANPPQAVIGWSLARSPRLGEYLADLDPALSLDWSNTSFQGRSDLREHVLLHTGLSDTCTIDDVIITAGTAEANFLALASVVEAGDDILVERPGWPQPWVVGPALGATVTALPRSEPRTWALDLDALDALLTPRTRVVFLSNPSNPTGRVSDRQELETIVARADRVGARVVCDEVYAGLEWDVRRAPTIAALSPRAIATGSVSKALGLQGLRIGWLICRDPRIIRQALVIRESTSEIMSGIGEAIAEIALRPARHAATLERARTEGRRNLDVLDEFIGSRPELSWSRPQAGLVGLCRLECSLTGDELARRLLQEPHRTLAIPGSAFGCLHHVRLGVGGGAEARLEHGLRQLSLLLDQL